MVALTIVNFISFFVPIMAAGAPPAVYPQALLALLQTTQLLPILGDLAELGVVFRGYPKVNNVYRDRREGLLERVARSQPERWVIVLIVLDDFYSPEGMSNIIDPAKLNIIGVTAQSLDEGGTP
ncbi:MAG: hypothetical protein DDT41_00539 [candidate division WS2 bacterium]|nr:hypothetical protein [Candidatus Psychracetigena formicireducens]